MLLLALPLHGRGENPVAWSAASRDLGGGLHEVTFTARITAPWHIYDMGPYELGGPNATAFAFEPSAEFELVGGVEPQEKPTRVDDPFMGELGYYAGGVDGVYGMLTAEGYLYGEITRERAGTNGFGYDPLFFLPERGCTTAQLSPEEKNAIRHRANALHALVRQLENR